MFDIFAEFEKGNKPLEIPNNEHVENHGENENHDEQENLANSIYANMLEKLTTLETKVNDFINSQNKEKEILENDNQTDL